MTESALELMGLAVREHEAGRVQQAHGLYSRALDLEPGHPEALHMLGVIAHQQGRHGEAVELISQALAHLPGSAAVLNNLGLALAHASELDEAEGHFRQALEVDPSFSDAMINLANLCGARGRTQEAVDLLSRVTRLAPDSAQAHYNLGRGLAAAGDLPRALAATERALTLRPDVVDIRIQLAELYMATRVLDRGVAAYLAVLEVEPDHFGATLALLYGVRGLTRGEVGPWLEPAVLWLLQCDGVNAREVGHQAAWLLEAKLDRSERELLCDPLARVYLRRLVNVSVDLELWLTGLRFELLKRYQSSKALNPTDQAWVASIAVQCFLNEHIWSTTSEEQALARALEREASASLHARSTQEPAMAAMVYAMYGPLHRVPVAAGVKISAEAHETAVGEMWTRCVAEPLEEQKFAAGLETGAPIRDQVSLLVRSQYEENPYPRWQRLTRRAPSRIEDEVARWVGDSPSTLRPGLEGGEGRQRVLIAGCGTGKEAIDVALHHPGVDVTAMDLSLASLAFAKRKAMEHGLDNLSFVQQDILELDEAHGIFHVIFSTGVLHHMADPCVGLARLVARLAPSGLLKLGLYSRLARAPLREATRRIQAQAMGSSREDIRRLRTQIFSEGPEGSLAHLTGSTDFYSTSECRDLLFHAQEHQLDLGELSDLLGRNRLEFLGFELSSATVLETFRRRYPDPGALRDLERWDAFEREYPESFRGMYQLWSRKRRD